jgi:hypothetical protein
MRLLQGTLESLSFMQSTIESQSIQSFENKVEKVICLSSIVARRNKNIDFFEIESFKMSYADLVNKNLNSS